MKTIAERILEIVVPIIMIGGLGYWAYNSWILEPAKDEQNYKKRKAESTQRYVDWAYVAKEKEFSPGETVKLLVIPSQFGIAILDTKCLIYTHREFKTSSMICPDAKQSDLEVGE
jgi:hypothetical protein